jgi:phospholipid/cholesterol/gamma-HCH transport system permease protein
MNAAQLEIRTEGGGTILCFTGPLTARAIAPLWSRAMTAANTPDTLTLDVAQAEMIDTSGAALLLAIERAHQQAITWHGLTEAQTKLLTQLRAALPQGAPIMPAPATIARRSLWRTLLIRVGFFGETILATLALPRKLRFLRGAEFFRLADRAGIQAVPLVAMMGFLIGMILAFQSAIPMRQFGAEIYVAALVAISLFRELGPLLAAVILAGRTGSAFAAELGTMRVNEEVDALVTMGVDPETMLVIPRMAAAMLVMPALTLGIDIAGLLGMGFVMMILGFPPDAVIGQVQMATSPHDLLLGLFKSLVFGAAIGLIGCRAGLTAGGGPRAVGEAATSAVVGGIVAIILLDGLFAVIFYRLGL